MKFRSMRIAVTAYTLVTFILLGVFVWGATTLAHMAVEEVTEKGLKNIIEDVWEGEDG